MNSLDFPQKRFLVIWRVLLGITENVGSTQRAPFQRAPVEKYHSSKLQVSNSSKILVRFSGFKWSSRPLGRWLLELPKNQWKGRAGWRLRRITSLGTWWCRQIRQCWHRELSGCPCRTCWCWRRSCRVCRSPLQAQVSATRYRSLEPFQVSKTSQKTVSKNRGQKSNINSFFSNFSGAPWISQQDIRPKTYHFPDFEWHTKLLWPPPLHIKNPHPTRRYPDPKVWGWVPFLAWKKSSGPSGPAEGRQNNHSLETLYVWPSPDLFDPLARKAREDSFETFSGLWGPDGLETLCVCVHVYVYVYVYAYVYHLKR